MVFEEDKLPNFDEIARQNVGAALIVRGRLLLTPQAKQPLEVKAAALQNDAGLVGAVYYFREMHER